MRIMVKYFALALFVLAMPVLAHAADKIGFVNAQDILANSAAGKQAAQDFSNKATAKQQELARENDSINQAMADFQKKSVSLSAEAKQKEQDALQARINKFRETANAAQQSLSQVQNSIMGPVVNRLNQVIEDYAKKNGFSAILDSGLALYAAPGLDVTADIRKAFDGAGK